MLQIQSYLPKANWSTANESMAEFDIAGVVDDTVLELRAGVLRPNKPGPVRSSNFVEGLGGLGMSALKAFRTR